MWVTRQFLNLATIFRRSSASIFIQNSPLTKLFSSRSSPSYSRLPEDKWVFPSIYSDVQIPELSFSDYVFAIQEKFADKICLVNGETGECFTHLEVRNRIHRLASALSRLGVSRGDTVALISPNCPEYMISFFAVARLGATVSTFSSSYTSDEIKSQLVNSDSRVIICHEDNLLKVKRASETIEGGIRFLLCIGGESEGVLSIQKLIKQDDGKGIPSYIKVNLMEDVIALPYSSGTTGIPKGVMLTNHNLVANMQQLSHPDIKVAQETSDDYQEKFMGLLPFYHIYGLMCLMVYTIKLGAQIVTLKEFNQKTYVSTIRKYQLTCLHTVPPLLNFLNTSDLASPDCLSSVHSVFCGAAPLGPALINGFSEKFGKHIAIREGYGMTEASPVTNISRYDNFIVGSCGPAVPNTWSKIIDPETKQSLKPGEEGEHCVKGPQVMKGYYKNEEATASTVDEEGWLHTGDIARMDSQQNVFIVDRLKELIKVKGLQVAPAELENILRLHPCIEDVAVIGVPDERAGELPRAYVVCDKKSSVSEGEIKEFVAQRVARHKRLEGGVIFTDEIPKSAAGKILRKQLRQKF